MSHLCTRQSYRGYRASPGCSVSAQLKAGLLSDNWRRSAFFPESRWLGPGMVASVGHSHFLNWFWSNYGAAQLCFGRCDLSMKMLYIDPFDLLNLTFCSLQHLHSRNCVFLHLWSSDRFSHWPDPPCFISSSSKRLKLPSDANTRDAAKCFIQADIISFVSIWFYLL